MAVYFNNIALLYKAQGKLVDARLYYSRRSTREKTLGKDHSARDAAVRPWPLLVDLEDARRGGGGLRARAEIGGDTSRRTTQDVVACEEWLRNVSPTPGGRNQARRGRASAQEAVISAVAGSVSGARGG